MWRGVGGKEALVCVCLRAELGSGRTKEGNARVGTKEGTCSLSDEECVRFLMRVDVQGR